MKYSKLKKAFLLPFIICTLFTGCSTNVFVQKGSTYAGKKVGIGMINITSIKRSKDSVCPCIGLTTREALLPYLQQAGFRVIMLPLDNNSGIQQNTALADSLQVDYILTGNGIIHIVGSSTFMEQLNIHLLSRETREVLISASFKGTSVRTTKAAERIGTQIIKKIKEK